MAVLGMIRIIDIGQRSPGAAPIDLRQTARGPAPAMGTGSRYWCMSPSIEHRSSVPYD